jgi:hypothetical protein
MISTLFLFQLPQFDKNNDGFISLEEYNRQTFDFVEDPALQEHLTDEIREQLKSANHRDTRRFLEADTEWVRTKQPNDQNT